jgi:hypothetical protein
MQFAVNLCILVFEYTFKYRVRMAQMSLHYLYNQKIVSLHMDVKERTLWTHTFVQILALFYCVTHSARSFRSARRRQGYGGHFFTK